MKKSLLILGGIAVIAVVSGILYFKYVGLSPVEVQKSAHAYVDGSIPEIVTDWDPEKLIDRASPGLLQAGTRETFNGLFAVLSDKLGNLKAYKGSTGQISMSPSITGMRVSGIYVGNAVFEKAPAEILCGLVSNDGQWRIDEFRVKSPALDPQIPKEP